MEACFFSSCSFANATKLSPKTIVVNQYQKGPSSARLQCRTIKCCRRESNSFDESDHSPSIESDWRSFRARLVAGERASRPEVPSALVNLDTVVDQPKPVSIGDKWAHEIHKPEKGCLLIATEKLDGVHIFERAVILLLSADPLGPSGIILNRPSLMSMKESKSTVLDAARTFSDRPLYFGGPHEEEIFLVTGGSDGSEDNGVARSGVFDEVMKGLYYGTKESVGCAAEMVKRSVVGVGDFRFFDGSCAWEKGQLNDEIRAGYWAIAACSSNVLGLGSVGSIGLWDEILGLLGSRKVW